MPFIKFYLNEPWFRCRNCNGKFQRPRRRWKIKRGQKVKPKFCQPECFREHQQKNKPIRYCQTCGAQITRPMNRKFCDETCYQEHRRELGSKIPGTFTKGHVAWNNGKKGLRLSPATEFKSGPRPELRRPIGAESLRIKRRNGSFQDARILVKVAQPNVWRAKSRVVWEKHHGPIPPGHVVWHKNSNRLDDSLENLEMISRAECLQRTKATGDNDRRMRYMASIVTHQRHKALRRERLHSGGKPNKVYPIPLYQRMEAPV